MWHPCVAAAHPSCCSEWVTNHHRDSTASHLGHPDMISYFAVAENESVGRVRYTLLEVRARARAQLLVVDRADHNGVAFAEDAATMWSASVKGLIVTANAMRVMCCNTPRCDQSAAVARRIAILCLQTNSVVMFALTLLCTEVTSGVISS